MHALYDIELMKMLGPNQHQDSSGESRIDKMRKFLSSPLMRKKPTVLQLKTFGTPLDILLQRSPSDHSVPFIVTRLCQYIQKTGLTHEGLFRISGNARSVERLRASFDRSGDAPLETEGDVPSAAALLKLFLRELPDPIIPLTMHCQFLNAVKDKDKLESVLCLADLVDKLPSVNYCILNYLSSFLKQVSDMEEQNRMSASSLGIVFGPNLFRVTEDFVGLKEQSLTNQIVTYFITDYDDIFKKELGNLEIGPCISSAGINNATHQISAMVSSWPETKGSSSTMMSSWSLGPLPIALDSADDSYLSQNSVSCSIDEVKYSSFSSCKGGESKFSSGIQFEYSSELTSECSSSVNENAASEKNLTSSSHLFDNLKSNSPLPLDKKVFFKDYGTEAEEAVPSHSMKNLSLNDTVDSSHSIHQKYVFNDKVDEGTINRSSTFDDECLLESEESQSKILKEHPKMSREKTEEMLKDIHKSYPRGRRRHVHRHKSRNLGMLERRSRSELRSNTHLENEDEFNGNPSSDLSQTSKTDLQYKSTGTLDEISTELRHSWPAFRKYREEEIALSPLPQQLGTTQCTEASVSPSAFRSYLSHRNLHLDPNLPPSPPVEQEDLIIGGGFEASSSNAKQLSRKVHALKKKIKLFEENFEKLYGYKPSHSEKCSNIAVKKMLSELNKARQDLKQLKDDPLLWSAEENMPNKSSKGTNTRCSLGLFSVSSGNASNLTLEDSVKEAMEYLVKHRKDGKRPENLEEMNRNQLTAEKVAIQKILLNFESLHGRPSSKNHRELVRPLYDRYRSTKILLARIASTKDTAELQPILEHETMDFGVSTQEKDSKVDIKVTSDSSKISENGQSGPKIVLSPHINFHELSVSELTEELNKVKDEKRKLRKLLRDFEDQFKKEHGHKAQREDKQAMESQYTEYKNTKGKLKLLEALVAKHEQTS